MSHETKPYGRKPLQAWAVADTKMVSIDLGADGFELQATIWASVPAAREFAAALIAACDAIEAQS